MGNFIVNNGNADVIAVLKKRRNIYTVICACIIVAGGCCGAIPAVGGIICGISMVVWGIFAGWGMLCINHLRYIQSGGRKQGGGLWWLLLLIFGIIVMMNCQTKCNTTRD